MLGFFKVVIASLAPSPANSGLSTRERRLRLQRRLHTGLRPSYHARKRDGTPDAGIRNGACSAGVDGLMFGRGRE